MNILLLTTHLNPGGITSYIFSLAGGMKSKGHTVIVASSGGEWLQKFVDREIPHIFIPINTKSELSPKVLLSFFKLLKVLKEYKIEIVHAQTRVTQVLGFLLSKFSKVVFISTAHGFFKPKLARNLFPCWGKRIIAISENVQEHLVNDFNIVKEKIRLVYNGINVDSYNLRDAAAKNKFKENLGLENKFVIGIVARLSPVKGHKFLLLAVKEIIKVIPNACIFIVGDGPDKNSLINLVKKLNIQENVIFYPLVKNTLEVLSIMDIFCMPSLKEGLGLAILEAQACGIPVIGSCVGGIKEIIINNKTGILVPPSDFNALKDAIIHLADNQELKEKIINNAFLQIKDKFSLEGMVDKTEEVYLNALS